MDRTVQLAQARFVIEEIMFRYAERLDAVTWKAFPPYSPEAASSLRWENPRRAPKRSSSSIPPWSSSTTRTKTPFPTNAANAPRAPATPLTTNLIFDFDNAVKAATVRSVFTVYQTLAGRNEIVGGWTLRRSVRAHPARLAPR